MNVNNLKGHIHDVFQYLFFHKIILKYPKHSCKNRQISKQWTGIWEKGDILCVLKRKRLNSPKQCGFP